MAVRAVFLDKDGTLVENVPYNVDTSKVRLSVGAEALRRLHDTGFALIVISNQPGVAFGYFDEPALGAVEARIRRMLARLGVVLTGFYYCPHHPHGRAPRYARVCACRKPAPGLLISAARTHGIDLGASWLIGDILDDIEAGARAGCRTVLIDNGNETEWKRSALRRPDHLATDLADAARYIQRAPHRRLHAERAAP